MKITLKIEKEFDAKFLQVEAGVRYWEDATVNGVEDTEGDLIPCRDSDTWSPIIELETGKIVNWEIGKSADIHYKVCDDGKYLLQDVNRDHIKTVQDYVISDLAIGESGYGDYIIMKIDENGMIEGWSPTLEDFMDDEDD